MPHVTFIHGIGNKTAAEDYLKSWHDAMAQADEPLSLSDEGVTSSLVYWADFLYPEPSTDNSVEESLQSDRAYIDIEGQVFSESELGSPEEREFIRGLQAHFSDLTDEEMETAAEAIAEGTQLERVPLPWFIKRRFLKTFLRDVHHYLFNTEFQLPGKRKVKIQDAIRKRFVETLRSSDSDKHVIVSHSMGTVIAYDCLKRVSDCPAVDGLITIGSPLGIDEIQDKLQPGWTREDGFPSDKVSTWSNQSDRLDPVCGFDPKISNDFKQQNKTIVVDELVKNNGIWRHSAT